MLKKFISIAPVAALSITICANAQASTITVQKGDTLWDLAYANNTTVENIQLTNHLATDLIHPGDVLTISQQKRYIVKRGDTLWDIARDYEVTVSQIKEWNELHTDLIHPGSNILIFESLKTSNKSFTKDEKEIKESMASVTVSSTNTSSKESSPKVNAPSTNTSSKESTSKVNAPSTNTSSKESTPETNAPSVSTSSKESTPEPSSSYEDLKEIQVEATAYTASCEGCTGITATGIDLKANPNAKVISVDPTVIPLGSKVYVEGYGEAIAGDTGGSIKGNRIDIFVPSQQEAANFGVKQLKVTILD